MGKFAIELTKSVVSLAVFTTTIWVTAYAVSKLLPIEPRKDDSKKKDAPKK